nr:VRR-NUC domain-containing protein [Nitrosomonas sp.]
TLFYTKYLRYDEISDCEQAIEELFEQDFIRRLDCAYYAEWLCQFKKDELYQIAKKAQLEEVRASWSKEKLSRYVFTQLTFDQLCRYVEPNLYIIQNKTEPLSFLLFLFFGKLDMDMKSFALRDLGLIRVNSHKEYSARFETANEAKACYFFSQIIADLNEKKIVDLVALYDTIINTLEGETDATQILRDKALFILGKALEKENDTERAIKLYSLSDFSGSKQRLIRLLYHQNQKDNVRQLLEVILEDPANDEDYYFASDFYARKFGKQKLSEQTVLLRNGQTIKIDEAFRDAPEYAVQCHFKQSGWTSWHTENNVWLCLFGLLFWDELFNSSRSLHSSFDRLPQCLKNKSFSQKFVTEIQNKLDKVRNGSAIDIILRTLTKYHRKPNGIFAWYMVDIETITTLLASSNCNATAHILQAMADNYPAMKDGFPDLLMLQESGIRFIEVKAEGDVLRRNQLTRLRQLKQAGFECEIIRTQYSFNPNQDYVVVDIETTGGQKPYHRITEIGAVKIRNHEVIDEWQTLINPQRHIPANITRLTGISNNMVGSAPLFSEIAKDFNAFVHGAIFAAHNVNFDYGFIAMEYQRLEQSFRYPKICTCASMRRYYPGHKSYSLANLCQMYQIPLETHHRALCDAKAAGHLLNLVNQKREDIAARL